jgi:hypothetical protein
MRLDLDAILGPARGSRLKTLLTSELLNRYIEVTFQSGAWAQVSEADLTSLLVKIGVDPESIDVSFTDYRDNSGDTIHLDFSATSSAVHVIEVAVDAWVMKSKSALMWPGEVGTY